MNKLVPVEPTEAMLKAGMMYLGTREDGLTPIYMEKEDALDCYKAMLAASPPSGGEVYQRLAQIAVYGDVWFDISRETFEATKENGITRILYTSPRVVDGVVLSREHVKFIADILENYDDCGPSGEGWQSQAMTEINKALQAALESK